MLSLEMLLDKEDWSLEEALRILTLETLEDLDAAGLSWASLCQLAEDVSHDAVGIWEEEDKDPRQSGLIFNVNGKEITVTTDYSGVAGRYWQSQDDGTFWMAQAVRKEH